MKQHSTFSAILVLILTFPFRLLGFLFRNKIILLIVVISVIALFGIKSFNKQNTSTVEMPNYQVAAPDIKIAPTIVETSSRSYYVVSYTDDGNRITLTDWFDYDTKKWRRHKTPLPLDRNIYGEIRITQR